MRFVLGFFSKTSSMYGTSPGSQTIQYAAIAFDGKIIAEYPNGRSKEAGVAAKILSNLNQKLASSPHPQQMTVSDAE